MNEVMYEKRYQSDGNYKIWEVKHHRYVDELQDTYQRFLRDHGENGIKIVEYKAPITPEPYVPTLQELKEHKLYEIRNAYTNAPENNGCRTGVMVDGSTELICDYGQKDRELWSKGIISAALAAHQNGDITLTQEDLAWANSGVLSPNLLAVTGDITTTIRSFDNKFYTITLREMHQAAFAQNIQMQADLEKKWRLEAMIEKATTKEELELINWND